MKALAMFAAVLLVFLVVPAASADMCLGCPGSGGSSGTNQTPQNRLEILDGKPGTAAQPVDEPDAEGAKTFCHLVIRRLQPRSGKTTVSWHTKDGTATHDEQGDFDIPDYQAASQTVTFDKERPTSIAVDIEINQDFTPAGDPGEQTFEDFFVVLTHAQNGVVVDHSGKCVIHDTSPV